MDGGLRAENLSQGLDQRARKIENVATGDTARHCRTCPRLTIAIAGLAVLVLLAQVRIQA
jgi:hypothetical protein